MSTSGTYSFSVTRDDIIRMAMLNIKRLDPDDTPTPAETKDMSWLLNAMVKQWQGKADFAPGLKTWTRKTGTLLLSPTTGTYTLGNGSAGWVNNPIVMQSTATAVSGASSVVANTIFGVGISYTVVIQLDTGVLWPATVTSAAGSTITFTPALPEPISRNS